MSVAQPLCIAPRLAYRLLFLAGLLAIPHVVRCGSRRNIAHRLRRNARRHRARQPHRHGIAPDGRMFVAQQGGALRVIKNGALLAQPFLTVSVNSSGERGLLGVAFDPNFASNNFVYVYYTTSTSPIHNRVSRFTASAANPDVAAAGSEVQLLNLPNLSSATNHNGGAIHFGTDGKLYIAVGDNANSANAQSFTTTLGKVLRINADGSIPSDNPFSARPRASTRRSGRRGLRNPFNFAVDRTNGRIHHQRRGPGHVGGGQPRHRGRELRLAADRGAESGRRRGRALSDSLLSERRHRSARSPARRSIGPTTANFPGRIRRPLLLRRFLRRLHPHAEPAELHDLDGLRHGHQLAGGHPGSSGRLALLSRARRGGELFRVQFTANTAPSISSQPGERHGGRGAVRDLQR